MIVCAFGGEGGEERPHPVHQRSDICRKTSAAVGACEVDRSRIARDEVAELIGGLYLDGKQGACADCRDGRHYKVGYATLIDDDRADGAGDAATQGVECRNPLNASLWKVALKLPTPFVKVKSAAGLLPGSVLIK